MANNVKSFDDQKWQAEADASTMAQYQEILADKARMQRAIKAAKEKAEDLNKRASIMSKVAGGNKAAGPVGKKAAAKKK